MAFSPPVVRIVTEVIGWDDKRLAFVLPHGTIGVHGTEISADVASPAPLPGECLEMPSDPALIPWQDPASAIIADAAWATAVALLANILAPAFCQAPFGIALVGSAARAVGLEVAQACGCLSCQLTSTTQLEKALTEETKHAWPLILDTGAARSNARLVAWFKSHSTQAFNCVLLLDAWTALLLQLSLGWAIVSQGQAEHSQANGVSLPRFLLPQYLQDLCQRRLWLTLERTWLETVREDLFAFIRRLRPSFVLPRRLDAVLKQTGTDESASDALGKILVQLVLQKKFRLLGDKPQRNMLAFYRVSTEKGEQRLFIPRHHLAQFFLAQGLPFPNAKRLTELFSIGGALRERRHDGWVIAYEWFVAGFTGKRRKRILSSSRAREGGPQ